MSAWGLTSETSNGSSTSSGKNTCWLTVAIIVGVLIFIFIVNDLFMRKQLKCKRSQKNVKFYDENNEDDEYNEDNQVYKKENTVIKKNYCS
jgi:hypothetical protein